MLALWPDKPIVVLQRHTPFGSARPRAHIHPIPDNISLLGEMQLECCHVNGIHLIHPNAEVIFCSTNVSEHCPCPIGPGVTTAEVQGHTLEDAIEKLSSKVVAELSSM